MKKLLSIIFFFVLLKAYPQTAPTAYYQFNAASPLTGSPGTTLTGGGTYDIQTTNSIVGGYIEWSSPNNAQFLNAQTINTTFQFTVQFWFRVGYSFAAVRNSQILTYGSQEISLQYPNITFTTSLTSSTNTFNVILDGINRKRWGYWTDGSWHHAAFVYNAQTGRKEIWIDGQLPAGFSTSTTTGNLSTTGTVKFNQGVDYVEYYGSLDEIAIYTTALDPRQIYKNYTESLAGGHYTTAFAASVPAPQAVTAGIDPLEYPPGSLTAPSVTYIQQLQQFPLGRYGWGHTLRRNINWIDPIYSGGRFQSGVSDAQAVTNSVAIQTEVYNNWYHMIQVSWSGDAFNTAWINLANTNPTWDRFLLTFRAQVTGGSKIQSQSNPTANYLQNSSGQFLDVNGNVTSGTKYWRPTAPTSTYNSDGVSANGFINSALSGLSGTVDLVNEDGEVFQILSNAALANDPVVNAARIASGLSPEEYQAAMVAKNDTQSYRDQFMSGSKVAGAKFTEYRIDGHRTYNFRYEQMRKINSKFDNHYYATGDFYVRYPYNWRYWISAWHGWQWVIESRFYEFAVNDSLWSPFVSAGWQQDEATNVRPAQWLGLLTCLGMTGVDFFYTSYFNEQGNYNPPNPPPYNPAGYTYQQVATSYAQATMSRAQNFFTAGKIMEGDVPDSYVNQSLGTDNPGYTFYAGNINKLVVVRKLDSGNKYLIGGTVQNYSNQIGNEPVNSTAKIYLGGDSLLFNIRRQGSVYIYDNTVSPPTWQQLDGWHESTHPYYWSGDFVFEAENYDSTSSGGITLATTRTGSGSDWTNFTTGIRFAGAGNVNYRFQNRTANTYYLYIRAKSVDGTSTNIASLVDGAGSASIQCITDTAWQWYRYNTSSGAAISYSPTADTDHWLRLTASTNKLSIDQVVLSTSNTYQTGVVTSCGSLTATITPSGSTTFCLGGSVTLTANTATSYLWSTGATTQAIIAMSSGLYTVTITVTGIGSATSSPETVTVLPLPTANVTPSGSTTLCTGGTVNLTATSNTSYLWSTAATTQSITVSTSGNYFVTVTGSNGCTKISPSITVTVNTAPTASISAGGATTFCLGGNVILMAVTGSGYTYQWQKNGSNISGQTGNGYSATTAGDYRVVVTASGCTATSNTISVTTTTPPTTSNAGSDQSVCTDSTLMAGNTPLTGTGAWSLLSGSGTITTASSPVSKITSLGAGSNVFRWTISNGTCTPSTDDVTISQVGAAPVSVTISPSVNPFCPGVSVVFTAFPVNGGTVTYQWKKNGVNTVTTPTYTASFANNDQVLVVVTSNLGCVTGNPATSNTVTLTAASTPTAAITAGGGTTFCTGGAVVLSANTGSGLTYQWRNSGGNISGQTASTYTATTSETYNCVITNSSGCTNTSNSITVTVNSLPTATITPNGSTTFCLGDSLLLSASTNSSYQWSNGSTTQNIYVKLAGVYTVTVTGSNGCTKASAGLSVSNTSKPTVTITVPANPLCTGNTQTLTATTNTTYLWNTGATTQTITADAGTWNVIVSNTSGCTNSATTTVSTVDCGNCQPTQSSNTLAFWYSAYFDWTSVSGGTAYIMTLINDQCSTCAPVNTTFNSSNGYLTRLKRATQYHYYITTICGTTGVSAASKNFYFKTRQ